MVNVYLRLHPCAWPQVQAKKLKKISIFLYPCNPEICVESSMRSCSGECSAPYECRCAPGWQGRLCDQPEVGRGSLVIQRRLAGYQRGSRLEAQIFGRASHWYQVFDWIHLPNILLNDLRPVMKIKGKGHLFLLFRTYCPMMVFLQKVN